MTSLSAERGKTGPEETPAGADIRGARLGHLQACAILIAMALLAYLPGFASLQPMDRDEPRFAQASKQMLESGDYVDIRFQGEARHKKPVGLYWLQAAAVAAGEGLGVPEARTTIALYRLPSLLGAVATVLLTYWAALAFLARREALLAAALMAACFVLGVEARLAKTDAVLAACATAAMGALARVYLARDGGRMPRVAVAVFWTAVAVGILVKGPLVPGFAALAAAWLSVRDRSAGWLWRLRPIAGLVLVLAAVAPWFLAIAWKSGGAFFGASVGHDMLGKVGTAQTQHWAPPGSYALAFFGTFWPGAALAAMAVPFAWRERRDDRVGFLVAWILPAWVLLELVPTKLPHYVLPLYPALAVLTLLALARRFLGPHRAGAALTALLIPLIPLLVALGLAVAAWWLDRTVLPWPALALLTAATALSFWAWAAFVRGRVHAAIAFAAGASLALSAAVFGSAQAAFASLKVSPRLAAIARDLPCPEPRFATVGYREPSLVFLVGTDLAMLENGREAARFLAQGGCRLAFVEARHGPDFEAGLRETGAAPVPLGRVRGFNINGGRHVDIGAYRSAP